MLSHSGRAGLAMPDADFPIAANLMGRPANQDALGTHGDLSGWGLAFGFGKTRHALIRLRLIGSRPESLSGFSTISA